MSERQKVLNGKRIGIFGKGGSGKSTLTVLLAAALTDRGYKVCILDADSTNIGLARALGLEDPPKTLLDYFGGMTFSGGRVTCPVDDPTPLPDREISLKELPPDYYSRKDGLILLTAGKIGDLGPGAGCDGPVAKIARDLVLHEDQESPVTLIDFKAGFEDSARGAVTGLDWAVMIVDPTTASLQMAVNMRDMVEQIKADELPATAHLESPELVEQANRIFLDARIKDIFFILNRVPDQQVQSFLEEKLAEHDICPLGVIPEDGHIPTAWLRGKPILTEKTRHQAGALLTKLEEAADEHP